MRIRPSYRYLAIGLVITIYSLIRLFHIDSSLRFAMYGKSKTVVQETMPVRMEVPHIGTDIALRPGRILGTEWELSPSYALYLPNTAHLGSQGNLVIYGHNTPGVFGKLRQATIGDELILTDGTGKKYLYFISWIGAVAPTDVSKLGYSFTPTATIITCDGWFDTKRLVIQATGRLGSTAANGTWIN
jgi:sortase (surface protein transpeptidase)